MARDHIFRFKEFVVSQGRAAMKVNTDGVLLGAWVDLDGSSSILDVGTGTGVIALMTAQRNSSATVTAIDIHKGSVEDAQHNVKMSAYSERMSVLHQSLQEHVQSGAQYDHIITNPPFFTAGPTAAISARASARHTGALSHAELVACSIELLVSGGCQSVVIPKDQEESFHRLATDGSLQLQRKCEVWINEGQVGRVLLTYCKGDTEQQPTESLLIRRSDGSYSSEYMRLTADFYLKF